MNTLWYLLELFFEELLTLFTFDSCHMKREKEPSKIDAENI